jgi:hypothetical protein
MLCGMPLPTPPEPVVVQREAGGWLAVSAPNEALRIGVVGADEHSARAAFAQAAARWLELCQAANERDTTQVP